MVFENNRYCECNGNHPNKKLDRSNETVWETIRVSKDAVWKRNFKITGSENDVD